jgi:hypothetical protein
LRAAGGKILSSNLPSVNFWLNDMAGNLKSIAKFLLYYSPLFLTLGVLLLWAKKIKLNPAQVIVLLLSFTFFLTMVWPTIDLAHFTFGVPALVLAFTSVSKTSNKMVQRISSAYLLFFLLIGVYKTFFMSYYTFETPYLNLHKSVLIRNEKISVDDKHETVVNALNEYKNGIFKNKSVFVYSYAPMVYFILDKVPPVHDLYTQEGLISENSLQADVKSLGLSPPDFILIEKWRWVDSEITRFIKANYRPIASIWDFEVWQKI